MAASYEAGRSRVVLAIARPAASGFCSYGRIRRRTVLQGALWTSLGVSCRFNSLVSIVLRRFSAVTLSLCGGCVVTEPWWGGAWPSLQPWNDKRECRDCSGDTYFTYFH